MPLIRYYSALFQHQLQAPYIGYVLERIGGDHNQVGELAHLHRAQLGADAADRSAMARGCYQARCWKELDSNCRSRLPLGGSCSSGYDHAACPVDPLRTE